MMLTPGKLEDTVEEIMNRINIEAVQEVRSQGEGKLPTRTIHFTTAGQKRTGKYGAGVIVDNKTKEKVHNFETISKRISKIKTARKILNITILNA